MDLSNDEKGRRFGFFYFGGYPVREEERIAGFGCEGEPGAVVPKRFDDEAFNELLGDPIVPKSQPQKRISQPPSPAETKPAGFWEGDEPIR